MSRSSIADKPADISSSNADYRSNETAVWVYAADEPVDGPIRTTILASSSASAPEWGSVAVVALLGAALLASRD
ncbi:hypothetical protein C8039_07405 [Halogeometricum sp. wsp3]|nr:hypothetical protein C8039_07405 [Halogeometricum sp. wsp3]